MHAKLRERTEWESNKHQLEETLEFKKKIIKSYQNDNNTNTRKRCLQNQPQTERNPDQSTIESNRPTNKKSEQKMTITLHDQHGYVKSPPTSNLTQK